MSERTLYLYDAENWIWSPKNHKRSGAILTVSLQSFQSTMGCTHGKSTHLLNEKNIGKKFELSILDPVRVGEVIFLGIITKNENKYVPEFIYKKMQEEIFFLRFRSDFENFFAFKQNKEYIIVNTSFCDVIPLF